MAKNSKVKRNPSHHISISEIWCKSGGGSEQESGAKNDRLRDSGMDREFDMFKFWLEFGDNFSTFCIFFSGDGESTKLCLKCALEFDPIHIPYMYYALCTLNELNEHTNSHHSHSHSVKQMSKGIAKNFKSSNHWQFTWLLYALQIPKENRIHRKQCLRNEP